jgi:endonuclease/exonuclease/phosphatase (EEP) superfamily protein YafD
MRQNLAARGAQSELASRRADWSLRPVIVAGDFNTPADGAVYADSWPAFTNAFTSAGVGFGYTHYTRLTRVRIDHVLAGPGWRVRRCEVGPDVGSAHRPVIAELVWTGGRVPAGAGATADAATGGMN